MTVSHKEKVSSRNIAAIVRFLPLMRNSDFRICSDRPCNQEDNSDNSDCLPQVIPTEEGISFIQTVEKNTLTLQHSLRDWGVSSEAKELLKSLDTIGRANELQLMKLLSLHVRVDKYVRGHLQEAVNSGHIPAILARLEILLGAMRAKGQPAG